jgi:hypothetical protein
MKVSDLSHIYVTLSRWLSFNRLLALNSYRHRCIRKWSGSNCLKSTIPVTFFSPIYKVIIEVIHEV